MVGKARDIHEHFRSVGTWVDWEPGHTCDGFKYGDPNTEVKGIAVGWQSLQSALEEAQVLGCNFFITHEPTFYSHMDDNEAMKATAPAQRKMAFLERTGMVVYRCHDVWDIFPGLGIVDAWSEFLGLGKPVAHARYYNLHRVPPTTVWELVQRLAQRSAPLGEQAVQLIGKKWQMVHRLAVGTGAITDVRRMVELGADVVLTTDDGTALWRDAAWMADLGLPIIRVNHMTAEIPGLRKLTEYLRERFPGTPVHFVGPTCSYEIFATERFHDTGIRMRRDNLDNLLPVTLPDGYTWRPIKAEEAWAYIEVMNRSNYSGECDQAWFEHTYAQDPEYDPSYLQIIWKGEQPVAAAGAWHTEIEGERWGMVHWVGVAYSERAKGLGKAIVLATLHRLRGRGFGRAMLGTQVWRLPAIAAYARLGFRPWPNESAPQEVWDRVLADLKTWRKSSAVRE
jgi:putative NIF3 family GTP cyclohydrolase 1 type 2/GNAT superfamily N-acetyltransferase